VSAALTRAWNVATNLALPGLVVLGWELAGRAGIVREQFLPVPTSVLRVWWEMLLSGQLLRHTAASLERAAVGLLVATVLGIGLGIAMGAWATFHRLLGPLVELCRPIPPIALIPVAIFWLGIGNESKIFLIFIASFFPVLLNTLNGVLGVDPTLVNVYRSMGATRVQTLWHVMLPSAAPQILTGFRLSAGLALIVLVAAEMVAAVDGLGYLILYAERTWQLEMMFAGIITISLIGFGLNQLLLVIGYRLLHWYYRASSSR
jgi:ABC-type nitrate/sulfonate/bicarbonate transport system permease component